MILFEFLEKLAPSDRVIIIDQRGRELYKGFGTSGNYVHVDQSLEVSNYSIAVETYKRRKAREEREQIIIEPDSMYAFSDIEIHIFLKIVVNT